LAGRFGALIGLAEGGIEELDEFWLSRCRSSKTMASRSAMRISNLAQSGQFDDGAGKGSFITKRLRDYQKQDSPIETTLKS
jgi:hypothetical protein